MPVEPIENTHDFWVDPSLDELRRAQGAEPVRDPSELRGDFWPDEETIEDFLEALHDWRGHSRSDRAA